MRVFVADFSLAAKIGRFDLHHVVALAEQVGDDFSAIMQQTVYLNRQIADVSSAQTIPRKQKSGWLRKISYSYDSASLVEIEIALRAGIRLASQPKIRVIARVIAKPV